MTRRPQAQPASGKGDCGRDSPAARPGRASVMIITAIITGMIIISDRQWTRDSRAGLGVRSESESPAALTRTRIMIIRHLEGCVMVYI